jgi:hypothetical protein
MPQTVSLQLSTLERRPDGTPASGAWCRDLWISEGNFYAIKIQQSRNTRKINFTQYTKVLSFVTMIYENQNPYTVITLDTES